MKVVIELDLVRKPAAIVKLIKLLDMHYIDGKLFPLKELECIMNFLRSFFDDMIREIKTFDEKVFSDAGVLMVGGRPFIQVIRHNNEFAWMWEPIYLDSYFHIHNLMDSPVRFLYSRLKNMLEKCPWVAVNLYLYCLKHELTEFPVWITDRELIDRLKERFASDVLARASYYYQEGFEREYIEKHWDGASDWEELASEAREEYDASPQREADLLVAYREIEEDWLQYTGQDPKVILAFKKVREELEIRL